MFTDPTGDRAAQVRRVTLAKQQQLVAVKGSDQPTAPRLQAQTAIGFIESACLWRIDMLSDSIRDRCPSEASRTCGAHPAAVKRSDQPTAPRLPAQTATGFIGSAVCRCPLDTPGSTSLWRIRQPLVCDRGLDSGLAIHRNGDWRRVAA